MYTVAAVKPNKTNHKHQPSYHMFAPSSEQVFHEEAMSLK